VLLSTHYYVLSLGAQTSMLFEAFRDYLIDIVNQGFPVEAPVRKSSLIDADRQRQLARVVDECFGHHYAIDPLGLVVVGDKEMRSAFISVTTHGEAVIGSIDGDHSATAIRDLGKIVWPVVKEAMSGVVGSAMRDLEASAERGQVASGLETVARLVNEGVRATLLVEDDYHMRGSIAGARQLTFISPEVDVRESIDDTVDAVIEQVLASGDNVVFTPSGSLSDRGRIVLLLGDGARDDALAPIVLKEGKPTG
jgi:hypothetical protein